MLAAFTILFAAKLVIKLDWSNTLSQLKTSIYTLEVMLFNFKKTLLQGLTDWFAFLERLSDHVSS